MNYDIYLIITTLTISINPKYPISRLLLPHYTCMVCSADKAAALKKLYGQPHFFQILSTFLYDIWSAIGWPTPYGGRLRQVILYVYIF